MAGCKKKMVSKNNLSKKYKDRVSNIKYICNNNLFNVWPKFKVYTVAINTNSFGKLET